ncbi:MAG: methyltransferase, partial [Monoglobaceae bacterium]
NPQTLEDYAYKKRYFGLSDEETIQYENLYAEERRKARENKKSAKTIKDTSGADAFFANPDNYTIEKTTHTKTGDDVWVVRPTNRLETEHWKQLNEQMKALGGSYWRGNQGWNFKKDPTAALSSTEETETVKGSTNAEKLRAVAASMQKAIDDKFRDRLTNTAKRAREAASAEAEGERLKRLQDTINNIADALEDGENTLLDKIDSKAQVETLMSMLRTGRRNRISETLPDITYDERLQEQDKPYSNDDAKYAEYPLTKLHENIISGYLRAAEGKTGYKQIADRLKKALKTVKNGYVTVDAQMFSDIDKIVQNLSPFYEELWNNGVSDRKRLARMGIENVVELRAYLREFINYLPEKDADAERQRNIKAKERQLANAKIEGFFPTPKAIVEKMLDEADIKPDEKVLEPSAGKGNIADAIRESYPDNALDVVEWNASLNELLSEKGHNVVGVDFLQHSGEYDKIIMNPPFEKGQDIDHIRHAYSLLKDGGRVVCVMSEGPFYRNDKKATEFREWLDSLGGVSEKLPEGAFKSSERSTGVNTRLVVIDKVASTTKPTKSKSGVKSSRDNATESSRADRWSTDRVDNGKENKSAVSVSEIIEQISTEFGIPISTGKVTDSEASGIYKEKPETIRTRISNNLPTISHELGHHLDKKYNLNELGSV